MMRVLGWGLLLAFAWYAVTAATSVLLIEWGVHPTWTAFLVVMVLAGVLAGCLAHRATGAGVTAGAVVGMIIAVYMLVSVLRDEQGATLVAVLRVVLAPLGSCLAGGLLGAALSGRARTP